jgi:hypothetical protein
MLTQRETLLGELKKGKVNSYTATYDMRIKQAPTRVKELRLLGYNIVSHPKTDRSVDWELLSEPAKPKAPEYIYVKGVAYLKEDYQKQLHI